MTTTTKPFDEFTRISPVFPKTDKETILDRLDRIEKMLGIFDRDRCEHVRKGIASRLLDEGNMHFVQMKDITMCLDCGKEL